MFVLTVTVILTLDGCITLLTVTVTVTLDVSIHAYSLTHPPGPILQGGQLRRGTNQFQPLLTMVSVRLCATRQELILNNSSQVRGETITLDVCIGRS